MDTKVGIDTDEVCIERCMVDLRERQPIWHDRLSELLILVGNDMGGIQEQRFWQSRQGTPSAVRRDHGFPERSLVNPLLHLP